MTKKKKKKMDWRGQLLMSVLVVGGVLFAPTSLLLIVGMTPTIVAAFTDKSRERVRGFTVGALNLAGCTTYIIRLWSGEHTLDRAIEILADPGAIAIMYGSAAAGYCLEWTITGAVSVFMAERAKARVGSIEREQEKLVERWGKEVRGDIPLDEYGFALEKSAAENADQ